MTGDPRSGTELLAGLQRQPELMGVLYQRHAPAVFRYLARRACYPAAAEDLLSEVFSGSALPWLHGTALNVLRMHFRQQRPAPGPLARGAPPPGSPAAAPKPAALSAAQPCSSALARPAPSRRRRRRVPSSRRPR